MDLISEGIKQKLIRLEDGGRYIVYLGQEMRRNYSNPEEKVQAESFLSLVLIYKYPVKRILQFVPVQMGSETKEADIIVYDDDALKSPYIITECKKPDVSELEFRRAADQAVSYAVAEGARSASALSWQISSMRDGLPRKDGDGKIYRRTRGGFLRQEQEWGRHGSPRHGEGKSG